MSQAFDRITRTAEKMNGEPCIRDTRLTVKRILKLLAIYPDRVELLREFPDLEPQDLEQALAFAAASIDDKVIQLQPA